MFQLSTVVAVVLVVTAPFAQTQSEMNSDARSKYKKAEQALNPTYARS